MNKKAVILFFPSPSQGGNYTGYPWPLLYLERMIRHCELDVILIDERLVENYENIVIENKDRILFAGVSAIIGEQIIGGIMFSELIRKHSNAPIIWGGWFPTVFPEMVLQDGYSDYVCVGQGEVLIKSFTEKMLNQEEIYDIPGLGYTRDGKIQINQNNKLVNPNLFPSIDKTLIDENKLIDLYGKAKPENRIFNYFLSMGCPYNCGFCNVSLIYGNKWYSKEISVILDDLSYYINHSGITQIIFYDDNFFANKKFVIEFCEEIIRKGFKFKWSAHAQVNYFLKHFTDEDIELLYRAGFRRIIIGAESGHQKTLDLVNKKIQAKNNLEILKVCRKHKILTRLHTMICFPYDPDEDFRLTMNMIGNAILIDPYVEINIAFFKPIPKTPIFEICVEKGFKPPSTTAELISSFAQRSDAPWYKRDYHKEIEKFINFYFLFANPNYYKTFPSSLRPFLFIFNMLIYPSIYIRFRMNWMKFPFEAKLFMKRKKNRSEIVYFDTFSVNKNRVLRKK